MIKSAATKCVGKVPVKVKTEVKNKVNTKWLADKDGNLYVSIDDYVAAAERALAMGLTLKKLVEVLKVEAQLAKNSFEAQQGK